MSGPRGVLVLGVHRSGTSVTAQVLQELGLRPPPANDLMPATDDNPTGYWESESLAVFNDLVLCHLGGSWSAIPQPAPDWGDDLRLGWLRDAAARKFARVFGSGDGWLWKDPRVSVLLGLWRPVLEPAAAVLVWRDPLEVAASLARRDGFSAEVGLAIWERTTLAILRDAAALPVMVGRYDALLADPDGWVRACGQLLTASGLLLSSAPAAAVASVDAGLRRSVATVHRLQAPADQLAAIARLEDVLDSLSGPHESFAAHVLPPESDTTSAIMSERLQASAWRSPSSLAASALLRTNSAGRLDRLAQVVASGASPRARDGGRS